MKGNQLKVCDYCGYRFFAEASVVGEQLKRHLETCYQYQDELKERAKVVQPPEPVPDAPEYQPPDAARRAARVSAGAKK